MATIPSTPITPETIQWAYRLFLDREPESEQAVAAKTKAKNTAALRAAFLHSDEFRQKNAVPFHLSGYEPGMEIEDVHSDEDLEKLFAHIQRTWQHLGETEPHWSVLTSEEYLSGNVQLSMEKFYASGRHAVARVIKTLARNKIDHRKFQACLEYGCGLGRVTRWLASEFPRVLGYEISQPHLRRAKLYLDQERVSNVSLHHLERLGDIRNLPKVDLIYSILVLQHNPPPVIKLIIAQFMRSLNQGGVALFQVPTYRLGYSFSLRKYLSTRPAQGLMELHMLPQHDIFKIAADEGARVIEVFEDASVGSFPGISNSFLVQKQVE